MKLKNFMAEYWKSVIKEVSWMCRAGRQAGSQPRQKFPILGNLLHTTPMSVLYIYILIWQRKVIKFQNLESI